DLVRVLHPDQGESEEAARHRAHHADEHAREEEDPADASRPPSPGLHYADSLPLPGHEEDEMADDGESGHEHDDGHDDEERELLQLKGRKEVSIHANPVAHPQPGPPPH